MKKTTYVLVHRETKKLLTTWPPFFHSMTEAAIFALENDLQAAVSPATHDLFGKLCAELVPK